MSTFPIQCTNKDCNKVWDAARIASDPRVVKRCPMCGASVKRLPKKPSLSRSGSCNSSVSSGSGRSAKETTNNNAFGFGLDNEGGLQNHLLSQLIPDLINTIRSQVLAQLHIPNNNNNDNNINTSIINNNNNNNLDAPQNNAAHIMDDSCWSEASVGDDVFGMNDMVNDGPGTQRRQQQQQPPPSTPNNYPSGVHVRGTNNKTMSQENDSNNNNNNPENSNNNTKSNNHSLASHNTVSLSEKQSTSANSNSPLPANLFIWDKNPQVRVHRIPEEYEFKATTTSTTTEEGSSKDDGKSSYAMLRPSLVALLGESKNFYKTHGRDIEQQYLHRLNVNEYFESQSYDEQIPTPAHQTPHGNNRQTTRNTKPALKFRKCVILDSTMLNYIAKFSPDGNEFNAWFKNNVLQK